VTLTRAKIFASVGTGQAVGSRLFSFANLTSIHCGLRQPAVNNESLLMWLKDSAKESLYNSPANGGKNTLAVASPGSCTRGLLEVEHVADQNTWYVSYRTNIALKRDDGERRSVRAPRKFKTEAAAKQFAEQIIKDGWSAIAGTLNPHAPKKTVASTKNLDWIAGKR
jgi:hypothetical protein